VALRFIDSFDHYDSAHIINKYDTVNGSPTIVSGGRNSTNRLYLANGTSVNKDFDFLSTCYCGFAFKYTGSSTNDDAFFAVYFGLFDVLYFRMAPGTDHKIHIYKNASLLGNSDAAKTLEPDTWYFLEFKVIANSVSGYIEIKRDGETIFTYTGDTNDDADPTTVFMFIGMTSGNWVEDLYILDSAGSTNNDFLGDCRVECLFPSANGTTNEWTPSTGSNYANVDDTVPDDDSTYNKSLSSNQIDLYAFGNLSESNGTVYGVQSLIYAKKSNSDAHTNAIVVRTSSTNYVGDTNTLTTSYDYYSQVFETDPNDSSQWTIAKVNAAEFGVKSLS